MIGIIVALNSEAKSFLEIIENKQQISIIGKTAYIGKIANKDIVLIISGIGKVNAAISTQAIIDKYSPTHILNFGTAGGMNSSVTIKDYYIIDKCCQYDFDLSSLDPVPVGYIQDYGCVFFDCFTSFCSNLKTSRVASGDRFNDNPCDVQTINDMGCSLRDMEGGAIGQTCTSNNVKLVMIKGVTDVYGSQTAQEQFYANLQSVSKNFDYIIKNIIECL